MVVAGVETLGAEEASVDVETSVGADDEASVDDGVADDKSAVDELGVVEEEALIDDVAKSSSEDVAALDDAITVIPPPPDEVPKLVDVGTEELVSDGKMNDQLNFSVAFSNIFSPGSAPKKFPQNT